MLVSRQLKLDVFGVVVVFVGGGVVVDGGIGLAAFVVKAVFEAAVGCAPLKRCIKAST